MTYKEKLLDPRWQKKRLEIMERDMFSCQLCGDTETTLNIHHKSYSSKTDPRDYSNDNFQTLCKHCHLCTEQMKKFGDTPIATSKRVFPEFVYINAVFRNGDENCVSIYRIDIETNSIKHAIDLSDTTLKMIFDLLKRSS